MNGMAILNALALLGSLASDKTMKRNNSIMSTKKNSPKNTMHPNGHFFHTKYNASPNKKQAKRLARRQADYDKSLISTEGYHRPGSNNK